MSAICPANLLSNDLQRLQLTYLHVIHPSHQPPTQPTYLIANHSELPTVDIQNYPADLLAHWPSALPTYYPASLLDFQTSELATAEI